MSSVAVWHDVECGGYAADLPAWAELADSAPGPLLELGCGTGRVALHLARSGHEIWAVDADPALLEALESSASRERLARSCMRHDLSESDEPRPTAGLYVSLLAGLKHSHRTPRAWSMTICRSMPGTS